MKMANYLVTLLLAALISPEAQAIATCESGDTVTLGTINYTAINRNSDGTIDTGAWQFNSYWVWNPIDRWAIIPVANNVYDISSREFIRRWPTAKDAPPDVQYAMFLSLWNDGYGWWHWASSKPCWDQWMTIQKGRAVWK